jgi:hypothetical protein
MTPPSSTTVRWSARKRRGKNVRTSISREGHCQKKCAGSQAQFGGVGQGFASRDEAALELLIRVNFGRAAMRAWHRGDAQQQNPFDVEGLISYIAI